MSVRPCGCRLEIEVEQQGEAVVLERVVAPQRAMAVLGVQGDVHRRPAAQVVAQQRRIPDHPVPAVVIRGLHPVVEQGRHQAVVGQGGQVQFHETPQ